VSTARRCTARSTPSLHAAASLGIAESAAAHAVRGESARTLMLLAENAIDLSAARAILSRAALLVDEGEADLVSLFAEAQAAKAFVKEAAARIVDRALALSGGAGYFNGHPLSRAYRDVRAGSFMHPLGANRAYDLLGDVALGRTPVLH
jgi:alkylation response protein AidB-like acyl-CoA dehydrogenase